MNRSGICDVTVTICKEGFNTGPRNFSYPLHKLPRTMQVWVQVSAEIIQSSPFIVEQKWTAWDNKTKEDVHELARPGFPWQTPRCEIEARVLCEKSDVAAAARLGKCVQEMVQKSSSGQRGAGADAGGEGAQHQCPAELPTLAAAGAVQGKGSAWTQWQQHLVIIAACSKNHKKVSKAIYN